MSNIIKMSDHRPSDESEHFKMIRNALENATQYVICIEFGDRSSSRITNMGNHPDGKIAEARLLERFARAIRKDESC